MLDANLSAPIPVRFHWKILKSHSLYKQWSNYQEVFGAEGAEKWGDMASALST